MRNSAVGYRKRGGFIAEYQAVYNSFTTPPSGPVAAAQNSMVKSLVDNGIWDKFDVFYLFAQESNGDGEALKNWKNPGTHDCTLVSAPVFASLEGFTGDGTDDALDTHWNGADDGVNYVQNDASIGFYSRTNASGNYVDVGVQATSSILCAASFAGNNFLRINGATEITAAYSNTLGLFIGNRTASNALAFYQNNSELVSGSPASAAINALDLYILA